MFQGQSLDRNFVRVVCLSRPLAAQAHGALSAGWCCAATEPREVAGRCPGLHLCTRTRGAGRGQTGPSRPSAPVGGSRRGLFSWLLTWCCTTSRRHPAVPRRGAGHGTRDTGRQGAARRLLGACALEAGWRGRQQPAPAGHGAAPAVALWLGAAGCARKLTAKFRQAVFPLHSASFIRVTAAVPRRAAQDTRLRDRHGRAAMRDGEVGAGRGCRCRSPPPPPTPRAQLHLCAPPTSDQ